MMLIYDVEFGGPIAHKVEVVHELLCLWLLWGSGRIKHPWHGRHRRLDKHTQAMLVISSLPSQRSFCPGSSWPRTIKFVKVIVIRRGGTLDRRSAWPRGRWHLQCATANMPSGPKTIMDKGQRRRYENENKICMCEGGWAWGQKEGCPKTLCFSGNTMTTNVWK